MMGPGGMRSLKARWVVTGELCLTSAAHLGNGEAGDIVDMPISRTASFGDMGAEPIDSFGPPILTGSSLAGGLRSYLAGVMLGPLTPEATHSGVEAIFGSTSILPESELVSEMDEGSQSALIVFDSIGVLDNAAIEVRDGVRIDPNRGVAEDTAKFDYEVIPPGAVFPIRVDLLVDEGSDEARLLGLLICVLEALERGEIPIGARKAKGLGGCMVRNWSARRFDLTTREGWSAWLMSDYINPIGQGARCYSSIACAIRESAPPEVSISEISTSLYSSNVIQVDVELRIQGGLLVRSPGKGQRAADVVHLQSAGKPILPGTSLMGALRARARRIAHTVRKAKGDADIWVDRLFGSKPSASTTKRPLRAARIRASEAFLEDSTRLGVTRIKIDRFTGGVVSGALLEEEPEFGSKASVKMEVIRPAPGELGFLALLVKDLITGDLVIGGSGSVGRGVATGKATIRVGNRAITLDSQSQLPEFDRHFLNSEVEEFWNKEPLGGGENT